MEPVKRLLDAITEPMPSGAAFFFSLFACPWLAIVAVVIVHELGHLIGGWAAGLKFVSVRFGPIQVTRPFRVSFQRRQRTGASAWTSMAPSSTKSLRTRLVLMVVTGPAFNLLSGLAVILLVNTLSAFLSWFAFMSMLVGICNLFPFHRLSLVSDGKRLAMLLQRGARGERWMATLQLAADLRNGVQPEDLRPDFLAMATAIRDESPDTVTGHLLAFSSSWYIGPDAETARLLEVCLQYASFASPMLREVVLADAAVFQGRKRKLADLAGEWLADLPEKTQFPGLRQRVEAAILEAQGDVQGSLRKLGEVEICMLSLPDQQQRAVSLRALQRWRAELLEKLNESQPATAR